MIGWEKEGRKEFNRFVRDLELPTKPRNVRYQLLYGPVSGEVVRAASESKADLVVMGSRGLGGLQSLMAGSVSRRVAHESPVSVLLVKDPLR